MRGVWWLHQTPEGPVTQRRWRSPPSLPGAPPALTVTLPALSLGFKSPLLCAVCGWPPPWKPGHKPLSSGVGPYGTCWLCEVLWSSYSFWALWGIHEDMCPKLLLGDPLCHSLHPLACLSPGHRHVLTWPVMKTWEQVSSRAQNWVQELEAGASAIDYQAKWKLKTNSSLNWYGSIWNKCQKLRREYGEFLSLPGPWPQTLPAYFSCQLPGPPSNLLTGVQFPVRLTHWERERERLSRPANVKPNRLLCKLGR